MDISNNRGRSGLLTLLFGSCPMKTRYFTFFLTLLFLTSLSGALQARRYDPADPYFLKQNLDPSIFKINPCIYQPAPCDNPPPPTPAPDPSPEPSPEPTPGPTPSPTPEPTTSPIPSEGPIETPEANNDPSGEIESDLFGEDTDEVIDVLTTSSGGCGLAPLTLRAPIHSSVWIWFGLILGLPVLRRFKDR